MKTIPLTQGYSTTVDDEDYPTLSSFKWHVSFGAKNKNMPYARRCIRTKTKLTCIHMSRLIMNAPPDSVVDHIDHNTLNNQKSNLRICSQSENLLNQYTQKNKPENCRFKGVSFHKPSQKFVAHYKNKHLGYFPNQEDAAQTYNFFAQKISKFSLLNPLPPTLPESYNPYIKKNKYKNIRQRTENCYEVYINHNLKHITIGCFPNLKQAISAFNSKCEELKLPHKKIIP